MKTYDINKTENLALVKDGNGIRYASISHAEPIQSIDPFHLRQMHYIASHKPAGLFVMKVHDTVKNNWEKFRDID